MIGANKSRVKFVCYSSYILIPHLPWYYSLHIICFLHLLSTNHKCTEPCYFPLILKPAAQKGKMEWNSLMRSSRLCMPRLPFLVCYAVSCSSVSLESCHSLLRQYLSNNYTLFVTFGYLWTLLVYMCGTIDPGSCTWWVLSFGIKTWYDKKWYHVTPTFHKNKILSTPRTKLPGNTKKSSVQIILNYSHALPESRGEILLRGVGL
jgi:hypothetical protein